MAVGYMLEHEPSLAVQEHYSNNQLYDLVEAAQDAFDASVVSEHPKFIHAVKAWTAAEHAQMVATCSTEADRPLLSEAATRLADELKADGEAAALFIAATLYADLLRIKEGAAEQLRLLSSERSCNSLQLHCDMFSLECQKHL